MGHSLKTRSYIFRSWKRPGGSSVFVGPSKRNPSFWRDQASKKPSEGESRKRSKNKPRKRYEQATFWESLLWLPLGGARGFWRSLGALSCCLAASWPKAHKKRGQKTSQETPRDSQELPKRDQELPKRGQRAAKRGPRQAKRAPKAAQEVSRGATRSPRATQESTRKSTNRPENGTPISYFV